MSYCKTSLNIQEQGYKTTMNIMEPCDIHKPGLIVTRPIPMQVRGRVWMNSVEAVVWPMFSQTT